MTNVEELETLHTDVAIVGLSCRFPGARDPDAFWTRICEGEELVTFFGDDELRRSGISEELLKKPNYVRASSLIDGAADFDASFFGISPREAELMDPQHRLFLELCWLALEDAGYDPFRYPGDIGVFAGAARNTYLRHNIGPFLETADHLDGSVRGLQADIGNYGDFLATRVSFKLGLRGPSMNVQTACSTSLVAVHLACQSLFLGESDIVLAGGVAVMSPQVTGYLYEEGSISSANGHCRPFDAEANGTVFGNGAGVVVLKRLADALQDNDRIIAVIKGTAINNDGSSKMNYSAPSVNGEAEVITQAQQVANVDPRTIGLIEAHGTGTALGDPIEIAALNAAFNVGEVSEPYCAIGAVKAQIGHLGAAAGIAGLIKTALALEHGQIPACVNFNSPNPRLALERSPFYIPRDLRPWHGFRRAGISSFGIGGTNAHAILEEHPSSHRPDRTVGQPKPFVLSARSSDALEVMRTTLSSRLLSTSNLPASDVAYTLAHGRGVFPHRLAVAASSLEEAATRLSDANPSTPPPLESELPVVFAFPGQGAQFVGMGRALYDAHEEFRSVVNECLEALHPMVGADLRKLMFAPQQTEREASEALGLTQWTQPTVFLSEYALSKSLIASGINPDALIGHSIGEYVAACLAGVFTLEDALRLVTERGRLMQRTAMGTMTTVALGEGELRDILPEELDVAAINAPAQCVVAGPIDAIECFETRLAEANVLYSRLPVSRAFHSSLMSPILDDFREVVASVKLSPPKIRIVSNLTGTWVEPQSICDPDYWVDHVRQPVRFMEGATAILESGPSAILEAGPGRALGGMFRRLHDPYCPVVSPWAARGREAQSVAEIVGELWVRGARVDWDKHFNEQRCGRVALPGYPFERSTFWLEPPTEAGVPKRSPPGISERDENWLQTARWIPAPLPAEGGGSTEDSRSVLAFVPPQNDRVKRSLAACGNRVVEVTYGSSLDVSNTSRLVIRPDRPTDVDRLLERLEEAEAAFDAIVYAWLIENPDPNETLSSRIQEVMTTGFFPLVRVVSHLSLRRRDESLKVLVVTHDRYQASTGDHPRPELALLAGPCRVIPQEYPNVRLAEIDVDGNTANSEGSSLGDVVVAELNQLEKGSIIAYRAGVRRELRYYPVNAGVGEQVWTEFGSYLITGGLGGIGLAIAEEAAKSKDVRLTLTHRSALPVREDWDRLVADSSTPSDLRRRLESLIRIRASGAEVLCVEADASDAEAMRRLRDEYGPFTGILHCAGIPGGKLIGALNEEDVWRVLAPKVHGAIWLDEMVADESTEWMVLCSSLAAVQGGMGQVSYCSANSFLDSFARWRTMKGKKTLSLNFDVWSGVGMAAQAATQLRNGSEREINHPIFSSERVTDTSIEYRGKLRRGTDWVVDEHCVGEQAILPGTAIIEFIRSAGQRRLGTETLEITDLDLVRPFSVAPGGSAEFAVRLSKNAQGLSVTLSSLRPGEGWTQHAVARIKVLTSGVPAASPFELPDVTPVDVAPGSALLSLGPRWDNVSQILRSTSGEIFVECENDSLFHEDNKRFGLHPALLDTATGALVSQLNDDVYLPMSYERVAVYRSMPARVQSCIVRRESSETDSIRLDVRVRDEHGNPIVDMEGYCLRRVDPTRVSDNLQASLDPHNQSLVTTNPGDLSSLCFVETERRPPRSGEVEVEVLATGLNFKEVLIATGMLDSGTSRFQFGLECAGVVRSVGHEVSHLRVGDPVLAIGSSCFSEFVNVRSVLACPIPEGMAFSEAVSIPVAFTTAYDCLVNLARLRRGERILIHAAAGGVGLAAIQVAIHSGAEVLGTAGSVRKRDFLLNLGVSKVMDSRSLDFERETIESGGVDVVLNSLAGESIPAGLRTLRPMGRFIELGKRDILGGASLDLRLFERGLSFNSYSPDINGAAFAECWREVTDLVQGGVLTPLPNRCFDVSEVCEAFSYMSRGDHIGKVIVCRPGADERSRHQRSEDGTATSDGITAAIGLRALRSALSMSQAQILVSLGGVKSRDDELLVARHVLREPNLSDSRAHARPELPYEFVSLQGGTEDALAAIWVSLLGIDRVGREDRFLDLGGDSLCATQVVARVRSAFGIRIAPADVLKDRPLWDLANLIDDRTARGSQDDTSGDEVEVGRIE